MSLGYIKAADTDYGYASAKSLVGYHVYKPSSLPLDLVNATRFVSGKDLAGKNNAIQVFYDAPFTAPVTDGPPKIVVLKQVGVGSDFNLATFASTSVKDSESPQFVALPTALNQEAYFIQKKQSKWGLSVLTFLTSDNVLIYINALGSDKQELLVQFAASLK